MTDEQLFRVFLTWVISGGGAGFLVYWAVEKFDLFASVRPSHKRYAVMALAGALSCLAFGALVLMHYTAQPLDWRAWVEALFTVAAIGSGASQVFHARRLDARQET
jgi:hypothetical protein